LSQNAVIIVAAGIGSRFGTNMPKQFLPLLGKPIILLIIEAFIKADAAIEIIMVINEQHKKNWEQIQQSYLHEINIKYTVGGATRTASVMNGLAMVNTPVVAIHDAARPLVSPDLISQCLDLCLTYDAVIPYIPIIDSLRKKDGPAANREEYILIQTPQTFKTQIIKDAYNNLIPTQQYTDDASVAEAAGYKLHFIKGDTGNIKITYDDALTRLILKRNS